MRLVMLKVRRGEGQRSKLDLWTKHDSQKVQIAEEQQQQGGEGGEEEEEEEDRTVFGHRLAYVAGYYIHLSYILLLSIEIT